MVNKKQDLNEFLKQNSLRKQAKNELLRRVVPEYFVDQKLKQFEKYNETERAYTDTVENYMQREREKLIDEINESFLANIKTDFEHDDLSRIVGARFTTDPLCSVGSIKRPPGGRFNFGQTTRMTTNYFQALYLANDYNTAFAESYHSKEESIGDFSHFKVSVKIDRYLDLRDKKVIKDFFKVIQRIQIPDNYIKMAKDLGVEPMSVYKADKELYQAIFSDRYKAWDTWVDQYSASQWFGFYAYFLGIPAMIYPSKRYKDGFNLVIYTENFEDTENEVRFKNPSGWTQVPKSRKHINSKNFEELQRPIVKKD